MNRKPAITREEALKRLSLSKARKAQVVEYLKQQLTEICIKETGKAPSHFEVF